MRSLTKLVVWASLAGAVALAAAEPKNVLVFSLTKGFRHTEGIEGGNPILAEIAKGLGYACTVTEDPAVLAADQVGKWNVIVFNNCTGTTLSAPADRAAFAKHVKEDGAGFMGFHSATDSNYDWPEYGEMINGYFTGHPWNQEVEGVLEDPEHPLLKPFGGQPFVMRDEIYQFRNYARSSARILMSLGHRTLDVHKGGRQDRDYALCWIRTWGQGRVFYNAFGHYAQPFQAKPFQEHIRLAMQWCARDLDVDVTPSREIDRAALGAKALESLKAATTDEQRAAALDTLSYCPAEGALDVVTAQFGGTQAVTATAAAAAAALCEAAADLPAERKTDILRKALPLCRNRVVEKSVRTQLAKLGVTDLPVTVPPGFVGRWWAAGPLADPDGALFDQACPPESGVDVKAGFTVGDKAYAWKAALADFEGIVNLNEALGRSDKVAGYMYAEVTVAAAADVQLKLGSDDGFVLWLNGTRLGGKKLSRGCQPGQDTFKAQLTAGTNRVLMKVLQGGGDWAGCLEIVGPDGAPLAFQQK